MKKTFWKDKKVTITGGNGFIGGYFVQELLNLGAKVININRSHSELDIEINPLHKKNLKNLFFDIREYDKLADATYGSDLIINCAALEGNNETKNTKPADILDSNMKIISNILNSAVNNNINTVVLISSAEIYSQKAKKLVEENDYRKLIDYTENGYVLSKIYTEHLGKLFAKQHGLKVFLPRLTNTYGPRDKPRVGLRVIPNMILSMLSNKVVEIWGSGNQKRTFIYVEDAIHSVLSMVEIDKHRILNIASRKSISILELAKLIKNLTNSSSTIHTDTTKPSGPNRRILVADKLYSTFKGRHEELRSGLNKTIDWHKKLLQNSVG